MENSIYKKLYKVQKEMGAIRKDSTNPFYNSKYTNINSLIKQLVPILEKHNLLLLQPISEGNQYSKIVDVDNGNCVESSLSLPVDLDAQKIGSAITYYRRYTLQALLGLQAEDDDGNLATSGHTTKLNEKPF